MLNLESIFQAQNRLRPYVLHTPLLRLPSLDALLGCQVYVKAECMQLTHSFKIRGGAEPDPAADSGRTGKRCGHGFQRQSWQGRGLWGKNAGNPATVVIPEHAPAIKIQAVRDLGANVILCEKPQRFAIAERLRDEQGLCYVPPFNDYDVMAGQGTIALEIFEDLPDPDGVVVPLGGGRSYQRDCHGCQSIRPETRVVACEPARIPRFTVSLKEGRPTEVPQVDTIADGVATCARETKPSPLSGIKWTRSSTCRKMLCSQP